MLPRTAIGLDVGRSAVKVVAFAGGLFYRLVFPSIVTPAIEIGDAATAARAEQETVEIKGKRYFTGDTARLQGGATSTVGLSHDWIETNEYLALVASTMKRLEAIGVPGLENPYMVIGTPASQFGPQQTRLEEMTRQVVSAEIKVLPQPMGAYCDFFLDPRGLPIKEHVRDENKRLKSWAVVEVGHFTTDFLLMREGQYIERGAGSCEGVNFAAEHLVRILAGKKIQTNLLACETALQTKKIFHFGERPIENEVNEAAAHVVQKIIAKANSLLSTEVATLDGVLLAGGGAELVHPSLTAAWPHTILLKNPRMSVADGFCRYGMGVLLKRSMAGNTQTAEAVNG